MTTENVANNDLQMAHDNLKAQLAAAQRDVAVFQQASKDAQKMIAERDIGILELRLALANAHGSLAMTQSELYGPQLQQATQAYRQTYAPQQARAEPKKMRKPSKG